MAFGEWRAYADPRIDFGNSVALHIAREVSPQKWEVVRELSASNGAVIEQMSLEENTNAATAHPMALPLPAAEALYHALARVFGNSDPKGTEDALKIERTRVDQIIQRLMEKAWRPGQ
jgi:hypothetical protein